MAYYKFTNPMDSSSSRFATDEEFEKASIVVGEKEENLNEAGVVMMDMGEGRVAMGKSELHSFIIGESGCGKTRRIVIPTIDMVSRAKEESMVIADPKGEIYEATAETLKKRGYTVYRLDFTDPYLSNKWNPFEVVAKSYGKGGREEAKGRNILREILGVMKASVHNERDVFWEEQGAKLIYGISMLILQRGRREDLTLRNISYNLKRILSDSDEFARYYALFPSDSEEKEYLTPICPGQDERTTFSIKVTAEGMLDAFCSDELLLSQFDYSDFDISLIGQEKTALFLILSDSSKSLYPIATVFIKELYTLLLDQADSNENKRLKVPVFFILDEFANFTRLPDVDNMLTAARSRGIRFMLVCQSMPQLHEKYGNHRAEILMSNCRIWIYMNSRDITFLERLSSIMGDVKTKYTGERERLAGISLLQHLTDGEVIVLNDRCYPMRGYLKDYSQYCLLEKTKDLPSFAPREEGRNKPTIDLMNIWKMDTFGETDDERDGQVEYRENPDLNEYRRKILEGLTKYQGQEDGFYSEEDMYF